MANSAIESAEQLVNLTGPETAARLRLSNGTLNNWRVKGLGPRHLKYGRKVLYPIQEIIAFEQRCLRTSTAQTGEGA